MKMNFLIPPFSGIEFSGSNGGAGSVVRSSAPSPDHLGADSKTSANEVPIRNDAPFRCSCHRFVAVNSTSTPVNSTSTPAITTTALCRCDRAPIEKAQTNSCHVCNVCGGTRCRKMVEETTLPGGGGGGLSDSRGSMKEMMQRLL